MIRIFPHPQIVKHLTINQIIIERLLIRKKVSSDDIVDQENEVVSYDVVEDNV